MGTAAPSGTPASAASVTVFAARIEIARDRVPPAVPRALHVDLLLLLLLLSLIRRRWVRSVRVVRRSVMRRLGVMIGPRRRRRIQAEPGGAV